HDQRGLGRVQDDDRLAALGAAYHLNGLRGGLRELVYVRPGAGTGGARGDGGDDLGVAHGGDSCDGRDHWDGGLAAAGHHVDVSAVEVLVEVDGRDNIGTYGRWREVDEPDAVAGQCRGVGFMRLGRRRVEDDADIGEARQRD